MKKLYGTYVFDDKSFFEKSIELNVDKWYLVINSSNEVFAVEEVRGALYFRLESRPGKVDEKFLDFGGYSGFSYIYMLNKNGISVLFNWALSFDDDINRLEENYLERKKNNTFQRILKFKRTDPIPPERFPVRSRSPGEAFFDFKQKKDDSK